MNAEVLEKYLESKGIDIESIDLSDWGQFLEDNYYAIYDKVNKQFLD